jgi:uncharacterized cupredoxin-like copper-binding protein
MPVRPALPATALLAAVVVAGCGSSSSGKSDPPPAKQGKSGSAAAAKGPLTASMTEFKIQSPPTASGPKVTWDVKNAGKITHEFVVLRTKKAAGKLGTGTRVPEPGKVGEVGDLAPGKSRKLSLKLKPGHYALICNLPGHYKGGMRADFTVK